MYPEALLADDDDGDLANGTPNECEINRAFHAHGLLGPGDAAPRVSVGAALPDGIPVTHARRQAQGPASTSSPESAVLRWRRPAATRSRSSPWTRSTRLHRAAADQPDDTLIEYQVVPTLPDETTVDFPINAPTRGISFTSGRSPELYCTGFEGAAGGEGWHLGHRLGAGPPHGPGRRPDGRLRGQRHGRQNLAGTYKPESQQAHRPGDPHGRTSSRSACNTAAGSGSRTVTSTRRRSSSTASPPGATSTARRATAATSTTATVSGATTTSTSPPASRTARSRSAFQLKSDQGLELAGWNIDELCVVGVDAVAAPTCGDGARGCRRGLRRRQPGRPSTAAARLRARGRGADDPRRRVRSVRRVGRATATSVARAAASTRSAAAIARRRGLRLPQQLPPNPRPPRPRPAPPRPPPPPLTSRECNARRCRPLDPPRGQTYRETTLTPPA
jgi:hypothetical protein